MGDFHGFATDTLKLGKLEVEYLTNAGPRIIGLRYENSSNLFADVSHLATETPYGDFHYLGGHRLWHAPEAMPRTYIPDDEGCTAVLFQNCLTITGKVEPMSGMQKVIELKAGEQDGSIELSHKLINHNAWDVTLAPWAITMFKLGGKVIFPIRATADGIEALLPDRNLIFWPYAKLGDPRLHFFDDRIELTAQPAKPTKFGTFNSLGKISYQIDGLEFTKQFTVESSGQHADLGCNAECYCDEDFVELESLGPLVRIQPGDSTNWLERWTVRRL